jgi:hypothetical protein
MSTPKTLSVSTAVIQVPFRTCLKHAPGQKFNQSTSKLSFNPLNFSGFSLGGARGVRVTRYLLGGAGHAEVLECTIEVEYEEGTVEHSIVLEPDTMNLASLEAFIAVLNKRLAN